MTKFCFRKNSAERCRSRRSGRSILIQRFLRRLIATTQEPKITLDKLAVLKVADAGRIGAFLDWGLEKDLLLPFKEQTAKVKKGDEVLVALYVDKSGRLCATMKVYEKLRTDSPYKKDDHVEGIIYETSDNLACLWQWITVTVH